MGPGSYYVDVGGFNAKSVDEKATGPGWARAYEVERMAALPHLLHKEQWEQKKELVNLYRFLAWLLLNKMAKYCLCPFVSVFDMQKLLTYYHFSCLKTFNSI